MTALRPSVLTALAAGFSLVFALALGGAAFFLKSEMAFAQAADSLVDAVGALILAYSVRVGQSPRDRGHPMGHSRAESVGALFIAILAVLLAVEVLRSAIGSLLNEPRVVLTGALLALFGLKVVFKGLVMLLSHSAPGPAARALFVDARNDVLVGLTSVVGFFVARYGRPEVDAYLALPLAAYIGYSGVVLARENVERLMGAAPPEARQAELLQLARQADGVLGAHDLSAQYLGSELQVYVHITVSAELTVRAGHDIGEGVRTRIEAEADVVQCLVHIDPEEDAP